MSHPTFGNAASNQDQSDLAIAQRRDIRLFFGHIYLVQQPSMAGMGAFHRLGSIMVRQLTSSAWRWVSGNSWYQFYATPGPWRFALAKCFAVNTRRGHNWHQILVILWPFREYTWHHWRVSSFAIIRKFQILSKPLRLFCYKYMSNFLQRVW